MGDIYIGVVESMLENLDIAFIKLDEWRENGFMVLKNEFFFTPKENIKLGEEVIVEIIKEPISKKGPTVTKNISLQDEEIKIYPSNKNDTDIAKGFNKKKKKYLSVVSKLVKSKKFGLSIAKKKGEIDLWEFVYRLQKLQTKLFLLEEKIQNIEVSPCLLSDKQEIIDILLKKIIVGEKKIIIVKSISQALKIKEQLIKEKKWKNKLYIEYSSQKTYKNYEYYIGNLIEQALKSNIQLNTGGHIVIEKTEALTSVDVNSGAFKKIGSSRQTILWINLAATKTIINELRLKNISGIIVIDFIGMINQNDQLSLLEYLNLQLESNLDGSQIIQISEIGLVEITRQRKERNVYDMFTKQCKQCKGTGYSREEKLSNRFQLHFLETSSIYG